MTLAGRRTGTAAAAALALAAALLAAELSRPQRAACADYRPVLVTCPVCGNDYFGLEIRAVNTLKGRDGDLLLRAEGGNQYATWIWTCPYCFFSARPEDLGEALTVDFDRSSIDTVPLTYEAKENSRVQLVIPPALKYRNAASYYYSVGKPPYFMGVLYLHGSWAVRMSKTDTPKGLAGIWLKSYMNVTLEDRPETEEETLLQIARDLSKRAEKAEPEKKPGFQYLIASTLRQAGEHRKAVPILRRLSSGGGSAEIAHAAKQELELAEQEEYFQREARRYFIEAIKFKETRPDDRLESIYLVGELSRRLGDLRQAEEWFQKSAASPMPGNWAREIMKRQWEKLKREIGEK